MEVLRCTPRRLVGAVLILAFAFVPSLISSAAKRNEKPLRISTRIVLDTDHAIVVKYFVESTESFYVTVDHGMGHTATASNLDKKTKRHTVEITVLLDHLESRKCMKELLLVGAAGGPSVMPVSKDYSLFKDTQILKPEDTFSFDDSILLLKFMSRRYELRVDKLANRIR